MFLAATLILMSWTAYAQNRTVSGVVADRDGIPLAGVDIVVKGDNTIYTATGGDGRYSITVPDGKSVLYFHLLGFLSQEISLAGHPEDTLNVTLEQDYMNLETVVVTGTRTPRLLKNSPILTRVITVQDIERVDALNIGDLLEDGDVEVEGECLLGTVYERELGRLDVEGPVLGELHRLLSGTEEGDHRLDVVPAFVSQDIAGSVAVAEIDLVGLTDYCLQSCCGHF